ncbi:hypothetical protein PG987_005286 [Apiospora arundinis]
MATPISSSLASTKPRNPLMDAVDDFQTALTDEERHELKRMRPNADADSIMVFAAELDSLSRKRNGPAYASRLHTILSSTGLFCNIYGTFASPRPETAALVWTSIMLTMRVCANSTSYYEVTSNLFMKIGKLCPLFADYQALYPDSPRLQKALLGFYASIVRCCRHAVQTGRRQSHHQQLPKTMLVSLEQEYKPDIDDIKGYGNLVEHEINLARVQADRQDHQLQIMERQEASKRGSLMSRSTDRSDCEPKNLHEIQLERYERISREQKQHVIDSLSTRDYLRVYKLSCRKRWQDTASWILQLPEFQNWLDGKCQVLWCSGKAGSGKTITSASVIQHIFRCKGPSEGPVSYSFVQSTGSVPPTANDILKSILQQRLDPTKMTDEFEAVLRNLDTASNADYTLATLRRLIPPGVSYIVIDGIDECHQSDRSDLLAALSSLVSSNVSIRLFICGRAGVHDEIKAHFKRAAHIHLDSQATNQDITRYIEGVIDSKVEIGGLIVKDPGLINEIKTALVHGAQGSSLTSDGDIRKALNNLPTDLDETFNRALQKIRVGAHFREAQDIFTWIKAAASPPTIKELSEAFAIRATHQPSKSARQGDDMDNVALWCGNLVEVDEESECVQFVHHSVLEFLLGESSDDTLSPFHLDLKQASQKLGEMCLAYLNSNGLKGVPATRPELQNSIPIRNPMIIVNAMAKPGSKLAAIYKGVLQPRQELDPNEQNLMTTETSKAHTEECLILDYRTQTPMTTRKSKTHTEEYPILDHKTHSPVATQQIKAHTEECLLLDYRTQVPMSRRKNDSEVQKTLSHSPTGPMLPKLPGNNGSRSEISVLRDAAESRHYATIRHLWSGTHVDLMKLAAEVGDLTFFDVLFKDMSQEDHDECGSILVCAASLGHLTAVQLMERCRGFSYINQHDKANAMIVAAQRGHVDVIEELIGWGVDPNIRLASGITPLEAAVKSSQLEVVDILLAAGASATFGDKGLPQTART